MYPLQVAHQIIRRNDTQFINKRFIVGDLFHHTFDILTVVCNCDDIIIDSNELIGNSFDLLKHEMCQQLKLDHIRLVLTNTKFTHPFGDEFPYEHVRLQFGYIDLHAKCVAVQFV